MYHACWCSLLWYRYHLIRSHCLPFAVEVEPRGTHDDNQHETRQTAAYHSPYHLLIVFLKKMKRH